MWILRPAFGGDQGYLGAGALSHRGYRSEDSTVASRRWDTSSPLQGASPVQKDFFSYGSLRNPGAVMRSQPVIQIHVCFVERFLDCVPQPRRVVAGG